jgi:hypothetical protein
LSYYFCSHKYHKIANNFIFEQVKKICLAKTLQIILLFTQKLDIKLYTQEQAQKDIGSGIQIRNTAGVYILENTLMGKNIMKTTCAPTKKEKRKERTREKKRYVTKRQSKNNVS